MKGIDDDHKRKPWDAVKIIDSSKSMGKENKKPEIAASGY